MFKARSKHLINNHHLKVDLLAQASLPSRQFIMSTSTPSTTRTDEPINLVSVNTAPERAKRLIGILIEDVKDKYNIRHAGNSDSESGSGGATSNDF
jgi:hypothetical protein